MMKLGWTLTLLASSALAGCGSHNHAPVVYGTPPTASTARIYTSPDQIAAVMTQTPLRARSFAT